MRFPSLSDTHTILLLVASLAASACGSSASHAAMNEDAGQGSPDAAGDNDPPPPAFDTGTKPAPLAPGQLLALQPNEQVAAIVADPQAVYALLVFSDVCNARWFKIPKSPPQTPEMLWHGTSCGTAIAIDATDQIFWAARNAGQSLLRTVAKSGGAVATLTTESSEVDSLAADADGYYWLAPGGDGTCAGDRIARQGRDGQRTVAFHDGHCFSTLAEFDGAIHWIEDGTRVVELGTNGPEQVFAFASNVSPPFSIVSGNLYWLDLTNPAGAQIYLTPLTHGGPNGLATRIVQLPNFHLIEGRILGSAEVTVWDELAYGRYYAPVATGAITALPFASDGPGMAVDGATIYLSSEGHLAAIAVK